MNAGFYADHHAATPLLETARVAMEDAHQRAWANPSSPHRYGRTAKSLLEGARERLAVALGVSPAEVIFTSGGTEACNLGVLGLASGKRRVVTTAVEHPAVEAAVSVLEARGVSTVRLAVPEGRCPSVGQLLEHIDEHTLVAIQFVNHETGTVFPVRDYAEACIDVGATLFVDASQALGKVAEPAVEGAHGLALASCKVGGPAGAGALVLRRGVDLEPVLVGGGQERGLRPGAPGLPAVVGFGAALECVQDRVREQPRIARIRDRVEAQLVELGARVNGRASEDSKSDRVATVTNVSIPGWRSELLVAALDMEGLAAAAGAACSSGVTEGSVVVRAMHGDEPWRAESALRLSFGIESSDGDGDGIAEILRRVLARAGDKANSGTG